MKTDLTKYNNKAVWQLLNFNNDFRQMLASSTLMGNILLHIKDRYALTPSQLTYITSKLTEKQ